MQKAPTEEAQRGLRELEWFTDTLVELLGVDEYDRLLDAAVKVLQDAGEPMTCKAMVEAMAKKKLWQSPGGKTPEATLYVSILRNLKKGKDARFKKVDRGQFALNNKK